MQSTIAALPNPVSALAMKRKRRKCAHNGWRVGRHRWHSVSGRKGRFDLRQELVT